jgi:xanthine/CO dehydrogenase XdhC/CoxF family maturation factor
VSDIEVRARNAAALKDNPLLQEILAQVKAEAVNTWVATPAQGGEPAREFAWMLYKAVGRIEGVIQGAIDDGVIAAARAIAPLR